MPRQYELIGVAGTDSVGDNGVGSVELFIGCFWRFGFEGWGGARVTDYKSLRLKFAFLFVGFEKEFTRSRCGYKILRQPIVSHLRMLPLNSEKLSLCHSHTLWL